MLVCAVVLPRRLEEKLGAGGSVAEERERERESKSRIQETLFNSCSKKLFARYSTPVYPKITK